MPRSAEGEIIPNIYGKMRLNGSIILMSDVSEYVKTQKKRSKTQTETHIDYTYSVSVAIGLC